MTFSALKKGIDISRSMREQALEDPSQLARE